MGFFNEKSGNDVETGSELKPNETNTQGQTDAVFGEVVEGGPNYRNVCLPTPYPLEYLINNTTGQLDRILDLDDEDSDRSWCAVHSCGV